MCDPFILKDHCFERYIFQCNFLIVLRRVFDCLYYHLQNIRF